MGGLCCPEPGWKSYDHSGVVPRRRGNKREHNGWGAIHVRGRPLLSIVLLPAGMASGTKIVAGDRTVHLFPIEGDEAVLSAAISYAWYEGAIVDVADGSVTVYFDDGDEVEFSVGLPKRPPIEQLLRGNV